MKGIETSLTLNNDVLLTAGNTHFFQKIISATLHTGDFETSNNRSLCICHHILLYPLFWYFISLPAKIQQLESPFNLTLFLCVLMGCIFVIQSRYMTFVSFLPFSPFWDNNFIFLPESDISLFTQSCCCECWLLSFNRSCLSFHKYNIPHLHSEYINTPQHHFYIHKM